MTALIIIGSILLLLFAIGMTRLKFRFVYLDDIVAVAQVLFIKIRIYPKRQRKLKARHFHIKRFRRRVKRSIRHSDIKAEKTRLKTEKKKKKKAKQTQGQQTKKKRNLKPLVRMLLRILRTFVQRFPRYLQVHVSRFVIGVATDDAAETAVTYGYVVQMAQYALTYVKLNSNLKHTKKSVISVYPDFTVNSTRIEMDVTLSIRVWQVLALGISLALTYLNKGKHKESKAS